MLKRREVSFREQVQVGKMGTWKKPRGNRDKRGTCLLRWRDGKVKVAPAYLPAVKSAQDQMKNIINFNVIKYH